VQPGGLGLLLGVVAPFGGKVGDGRSVLQRRSPRPAAAAPDGGVRRRAGDGRVEPMRGTRLACAPSPAPQPLPPGPCQPPGPPWRAPCPFTPPPVYLGVPLAVLRVLAGRAAPAGARPLRRRLVVRGWGRQGEGELHAFRAQGPGGRAVWRCGGGASLAGVGHAPLPGRIWPLARESGPPRHGGSPAAPGASGGGGCGTSEPSALGTHSAGPGGVGTKGPHAAAAPAVAPLKSGATVRRADLRGGAAASGQSSATSVRLSASAPPPQAGSPCGGGIEEEAAAAPARGRWRGAGAPRVGRGLCEARTLRRL
jgi:hypothetical protein